MSAHREGEKLSDELLLLAQIGGDKPSPYSQSKMQGGVYPICIKLTFLALKGLHKSAQG